MKRYYYHGIESYHGYVGHTLETMVRILNKGILTRNKIKNYNDKSLEHVCLYKKNEDLDYTQTENIIKSACAGWINDCFVFIINPDIEAQKAKTGIETDLVDEWRTTEDIKPTDIYGIALPFSFIKTYLNEEIPLVSLEEKIKIRKNLKILLEKAQEMNIMVIDSEIKNFTDELDSTLNMKKSK